MRNNIVFRDVSKKNGVDPNSYCVFGWTRSKISELERGDKEDYDWESYSEIAFWSFAQSYYDSAEVLFQKFKESKGDNRILDATGITICFLYRHFVELFLKYLYISYAHPTEEECKTFLHNGHKLCSLWNKLNPILQQKIEKYNCSSDVKDVERYIMDINHFDKDSMKMRYPITIKDMSPTSERIKLDIINLHQRMEELYVMLDDIDTDIPKYELPDMSQEQIDIFLEKYSELKLKIESFLSVLKSKFDEMSEGGVQKSNCQSVLENLRNPQPSPFDALSDDELILLDTLYYTGDAIRSGGLKLPKNPCDAKVVAVKRCILNMKRDELVFGKSLNNNIGVKGKQYSLIIENVSKVLSAIESDCQY